MVHLLDYYIAIKNTFEEYLVKQENECHNSKYKLY